MVFTGAVRVNKLTLKYKFWTEKISIRKGVKPLLHLDVTSTVQCTTPKTKDKKDATKGACAATW